MLPLWFVHAVFVQELAGVFGVVLDRGEALSAKDFAALVVSVVGASAEGESDHGA